MNGNGFLKGQLVPIVGYNQGVAGNQTSQMLARQSTGLALNPEVYTILGGTNDIVVGGLSAATIITNLSSLRDNALNIASVKYVVLCTILNRTGLTAGQETVRQTVNAWIRSNTGAKVIVCDYENSTFDPATMTSDGLHPNIFGAWLLGQFLATVMAPYFTPTDVLADTTGNLLVNPTLSGTGGTFTGTTGPVATSWQVRNFSGLTAVCSKGVDAYGNATQIVTLNGTATGGAIQLRNFPTYTGTAGEVYECIARLDVANGTSLGNINCTSTAGPTVLAWGGNSSIPINASLNNLIIRNGRVALATSQTTNTYEIDVNFPSGAVCNNTIIILTRPIWRKVN